MYILKNFGGKDRVIRCNQGAMDVYWGRINFTELGASVAYACLYSGLIGECLHTGTEADFKYSDVVEWADELTENGRHAEIKEACDVFTEATAYKHRIKTIAERIESLNEEFKEQGTPKKKTSRMKRT